MAQSFHMSPEDLEKPYRAAGVVRQRMATLAALGLSAGERALDAGCGVGLLTRAMALEVGSAGQVLGVDLSEEMAAATEARCADLPQARAAAGSVLALPAADAEFDAAACTQVLLYVEEPVAALVELARILKPGGRLAVVETDWRGAVIGGPDPALSARAFAGWDARTPSPNLPPKLPALLRAAGFAAIRAEAVPILETSLSDGGFLHHLMRPTAAGAVKAGMLSEAESQAWLRDLERAAAEGGFFFCVNRFLFSAVKI